MLKWNRSDAGLAHMQNESKNMISVQYNDYIANMK